MSLLARGLVALAGLARTVQAQNSVISEDDHYFMSYMLAGIALMGVAGIGAVLYQNNKCCFANQQEAPKLKK